MIEIGNIYIATHPFVKSDIILITSKRDKKFSFDIISNKSNYHYDFKFFYDGSPYAKSLIKFQGISII